MQVHTRCRCCCAPLPPPPHPPHPTHTHTTTTTYTHPPHKPVREGAVDEGEKPVGIIELWLGGAQAAGHAAAQGEHLQGRGSRWCRWGGRHSRPGAGACAGTRGWARWQHDPRAVNSLGGWGCPPSPAAAPPHLYCLPLEQLLGHAADALPAAVVALRPLHLLVRQQRLPGLLVLQQRMEEGVQRKIPACPAVLMKVRQPKRRASMPQKSMSGLPVVQCRAGEGRAGWRRRCTILNYGCCDTHGQPANQHRLHKSAP